MLTLGSYPTPVQPLEQLSTASSSLWVKRDDLTHPLYGGSKLRKLEPLLEDARREGATRLVTLGALGSHHVLATGVFGRLAGLAVEAVVLPRPRSWHVLEITRATLAQGVTLVPAADYTAAARTLSASAARGAYSIPAGGSNLLGTRGVSSAASELAEQVRAGLLPEPDLIVVALGSGGTAAGLAAGLERAGLRTRVLAIAVAAPVPVFARKARRLLEELLGPAQRANATRRLQIEASYLGDGYGYSTEAGQRALRQASQVGLSLDSTYTAKAFAAALDQVQLGRERQILFWHTLSSAPLAPLLVGAPPTRRLAPDLQRLAR